MMIKIIMSLHLFELQNEHEPLMFRSELFHIAIRTTSISDLADLLIHLSEYNCPVDEGAERYQ